MGAAGEVFREESAESAQVDVFYAAWVADILEQAVQSLLEEYHRAGKGDYFRVLYSRICEEMTMPEIADSLSISLTSVENYFKAARKQLASKMEELVQAHTARYCQSADCQQEWQAEWLRLGTYLTAHGGLDDVLRKAASGRSIFSQQQRKTTLISSTLSRIHAGMPLTGAK